MSSVDSIVWKICYKQPNEAWETSEGGLTPKPDNRWHIFAFCFFLLVKAAFALSCLKSFIYLFIYLFIFQQLSEGIFEILACIFFPSYVCSRPEVRAVASLFLTGIIER